MFVHLTGFRNLLDDDGSRDTTNQKLNINIEKKNRYKLYTYSGFTF